MFLLDSGIFIRELRGDPRPARLVAELEKRDEIAMSAVSLFEVVRGARTDEELELLLRHIEIVDVDQRAARAGARLVRDHRGILSGEFAVPDALIAGTAIANAATLVTLNRRQFAPLVAAGVDLILIEQDAADWTSGLP